MKNLSSVQCGIKPLEGVLNRMVNGINARTPVAGAGILITESNGSVVISRSQKDDDKGQTGNQVGGGADPLAGTAWMTVTIVDPGSCAQSEIQVLTRPVQ